MAAGTGTLPAESVRAMFDRIAGVYDVMNTVMTAGLHHQWRTRAVDLARVGPGTRALDVATGTGDLAIELASRGGDVVGSDFSEGMLDRARAKAPGLTWEQADAMALPYPDDAFDATTVGFGARNFGDLPQGLREMVRVVKPGGPRGHPRDHDPAEAATFHVLLFVVRSCRATDRAASTRRTPTCRTRSSGSLGRTPLAGELVAAGCRDVRLDPDRRRDHRDPPRDGRVAWRAPRRSPRSSRQGERTSPG